MLLPPMRVSALLLIPGALVAILAFDRGGFFPDSVGLAATALGVVLAARLLLAADPFESVSGIALLAGGALSLLAAWTLLSAAWSDMDARAMLEFDRVVLYAFAFWVFATIGRTPGRLRVLVRALAVGIAAVCLSGLLTRVLPEVWGAPPNIEPERLSWPVTYWNGLGLLAAVGLLLALHHAADAHERAGVRVLGAAAAPLLAATLVLTFSRGAVVAGALALVAYAVLARPSGFPAAVASAGPAIAVAVIAALDADLLSSGNPTAPAAVAQGEDLALVLGACAAAAAIVRWALLGLDARVVAWRPGAAAAMSRRRPLVVAAATVVVAGLVASSAAAGLPARAELQYKAFVDGSDVTASQTRTRLLEIGNNGRLEHWDVALEGFRSDPLRGSGAGTYEAQWARYRSTNFTVVDGHSLYLETLGELGLPGLLLLVTFIAAALAGLARRIRGPHRAVGAALFSCTALWAVHAGIDWDWELTAVTVWVGAVAGAGLARPLGAGRALRRPPRRIARVGLATAVLLVAATPAVAAVSQQRLDAAVEAAQRGDCRAAVRSARASRDAVSSRPEPLEVLAYCALRAGTPGVAVDAMRAAVVLEPRTSRLHVGLALSLALDGADPRPAVRTASELDPRDLRIRRLASRFGDRAERADWPRRAAREAGMLIGRDRVLRPAGR